MAFDTILLRGVLREDGTLELPEKIGLPSGPVEITVRTLVKPTGEDVLTVLDRIQAEQEASGYVPRSVEEVDAQLQQMRDEWEEHSLALEKIQEDAQRAREASSRGNP